MDWIDDTVAVGNRQDGLSARRRGRENVEIVIDARLLFTQNLFSSKRTPLVEKLLRARDLLVELSALKIRVLVYCNRGRDRSSFLAMLYMSKRYGLNYQEAYAKVKTKRKVTAFHWDWVDMFEKYRSP
jgi:Dual specificity phosphatase, catalytic domain